MRAGVIALAGLAGGCNVLLGLDPTSLDDDGGGPDADAGIRWDTPTPVGVASSVLDEDDPAMGPGGLELYWSAGGASAKDIYRSTRMDVGDPFVTFQPVPDLNSAATDAAVRISADGLTLYMSSDRVVFGDIDVLAATRTGPKWTVTGALAPPLSSTSSDLGATPCLAGGRIFLASDRALPGDFDILEIIEGEAVYAAATAFSEVSPFVTEDCLTLYYAMDRNEGRGQDLYVSTRAELNDAWSEPQVIEDLSSEDDDQDPWISADGTVFLFASNRSGTWDLWEARRMAR